jgi:hypothetical protein
MKSFTTPKGVMAAVLCYSAIITFSSFLVETVYAHNTGSAGSININNHQHGRIVSVSELLLQVTPFTAGLAMGFSLLFWKKEIINKFRWNMNPKT